ncbi:helix-turn-helix domain-containing protein [Maribacter sp. CXY002]|uniref:helix-turn-helix domain-containing protein n=1 Tax=Maribacter luteocoastalis TaxID=3407671 RepID=UPI003B66E013
MSNELSNKSTFIEQAEAIILENLANEQFGVSELAEAMHMSRSNLLRKIKKQTKLSASQFIRQIRLQEAMTLLKETSSTVSEISYQVGFGSTSYFIKCFREQYGFPPGEVGKGIVAIEKEKTQTNFLKRYRWPIIATTTIVLIVASYLLFKKKDAIGQLEIEKSIAILPFKNESSDSTNLYFVNGLMESALYNLQKIEDLRVISRTSVEKYRKTDKGIPEIAKELNVNYLVEGSGQRIGNQVLLNIQLIEASSDTPIWVEQYNQEVVDIFALQNDVAKKIADAIEAVVTPAELEQIGKKPTENLLAYDYYLQALEPYLSRTKEGLDKAIPLFQKAVEQDSQFALAYANLAISYYYLDIFQQQKQYTEVINNYADKALLYDSKNDISLISKALYYMHTEEYRLALPHLEKALEYNPNSAAVVQVLSRLYSIYIPDTGKYLKNALMGVQLDVGVSDSVAQSFIYLDLSNALAQNGFIKKAMIYIDKTLDYDSKNFYAPHLKAFIKYAINQDIEELKKVLEKEFEKDSTRLDILQDIAKLYYFQEDHERAYVYYEKFVKAKRENGLNIYPQEDAKIALVYKKMGFEERASHFFNAYANYCERDKSIYKSASMALKYAYEGNIELGIEQLKVFASQDHYQYWILLFIEKDPLMKPLKGHPDYKATIKKIKDKFWENHAELKKTLEENKLI